MKKTILLFAVAFALSAGTAMAQAPKDAKPAAAKETKSVVEFNKKIYDFGEIPQNIPATAMFEYKNVSKEPVILKNVVGSCGCTVPEWPKEPTLPGKKNQIKATYNAAAVGPFTKTVTVTLSNGENVLLTIQGTVKDASKAKAE